MLLLAGDGRSDDGGDSSGSGIGSGGGGDGGVNFTGTCNENTYFNAFITEFAALYCASNTLAHTLHKAGTNINKCLVKEYLAYDYRCILP